MDSNETKEVSNDITNGAMEQTIEGLTSFKMIDSSLDDDEREIALVPDANSPAAAASDANSTSEATVSEAVAPVKEEIEIMSNGSQSIRSEHKNTEFTYTSLTEMSDANDDDEGKNENGKLKSDSDANNADKKQLEFIMEKLKCNQVSNKEVVDFVLNLLVGGSFDLEKNFIISHKNNILYMIQVIKCASDTLKAELWSLFTAILRKSYLNVQACVEIGLIETALHELSEADNVCAGIFI